MHLSTSRPIYLPTYPSLYLSTCPNVRLFASLPVYLSTCPPLYLPTCPSAYLSTCPPLCLSTCPPVHLSACLPVVFCRYDNAGFDRGYAKSRYIQHIIANYSTQPRRAKNRNSQAISGEMNEVETTKPDICCFDESER